MKIKLIKKFIGQLKLVEPDSDIKKVSSYQAFMAGQMNMLLRIKMFLREV